MSREAEIQDALRDLIKGLIAKKFRFGGLDITHMKRDYLLRIKKKNVIS